jgi:hypothetical protein
LTSSPTPTHPSLQKGPTTDDERDNRLSVLGTALTVTVSWTKSLRQIFGRKLVFTHCENVANFEPSAHDQAFDEKQKCCRISVFNAKRVCHVLCLPWVGTSNGHQIAGLPKVPAHADAVHAPCEGVCLRSLHVDTLVHKMLLVTKWHLE